MLNPTHALFYWHQLGVAIPGGADAIGYAARLMSIAMTTPNGSHLIGVKIDFSNAFNTIDRAAILAVVRHAGGSDRNKQ